MLQRSGTQKWRSGVLARALTTIFVAFLIAAGTIKMDWRDYWLLTAVALAHYAFIWYASPRAGVWLDWVNLVVDSSMTVLLLQLSGRTESPLTVLVYVWMFAMVTLNVRRGNNYALFLIAAVGLLTLAAGAAGDPRWASFMPVHLMGISLFVFTSMTLMGERRSNQLDPLTLVLNRRAGLERLAEMMQSGETFDLAYIDLKGFKAINDTHGHAIGDEVLMGLAGRLRKCVRNGDLVMRLGGDEFLVTGPPGSLSTRLRKAFSGPVRTSQGALPISGDIGVVRWRGESTDIESLLAQADAAMYRMKYTDIREDH